MQRTTSSPTVRQCLLRIAAFAALFTAPAAVAQAQNAGAPLVVTTFAGQAGTRHSTNGTGAAARFSSPTGLGVLPNGDLILADASNNIFRRITPAGAVTYFSGRPTDLEDRPINTGSTDGPAADARFYIGLPAGDPVGSYTLGVDGSGNIYFADTLNNTIRRLAADGTASTIAGVAGQEGIADGTGTAARFSAPTGVAVDPNGNVYVADSGNNTIRRITPGGAVTTFAGVSRTFGNTNGTGATARFLQPSGIVADRSGNLYVTDTGNHTIRKITPGAVVTTFAGSPGIAGSSDGSGSFARFNYPTAIAIDSAGTLYVTDTSNQTIRRITAAGAVTTVAGSPGVSGSADGTGNAARFLEPRGITVDPAGAVYVADTGNQTIRRGVAATGSSAPTLQITSQPQRQQVILGSTATFRVVATGSPSPTYQWMRNGEAIAGATSATYTRSNAQFADRGFYSVLVTAGTAQFTSTPAELQVFPSGTTIPPIVILAQPTDREVIAGQPVTFEVEVSSAGAVSYQWAKNNTPIPGAISANYTIGSVSSGDAGVYTVTVSGSNYTTSTAGSTLTVLTASSTTPPSITTQPASQSVNTGGTVTFTVAATGTPAPTVFQWRKNGTPIADGPTGSGSAISGATTASLTITNATAADAGNYSVVVANTVGPVTSAAAALTVNAAPPMSRIINLSILTGIDAPGDSFTMGYVVGGAGTAGAKPLVIRAAGPSLGALGVPGTLNDPKLELFAGSTKTGENDNWGGSAQLAAAMAAVGAFAYTSPTSLDAAASLNVTTRDNSVKVSAAGAGTGQVIAEVYDATPESSVSVTTPRLINVSVLKEFGTGFTAGFVIRGATSKRVLIRAIGPGLAAFGITSGFVADPQVRLFRQQTELRSNNDWEASAAATFTQVGAFMLTPGSRDAALLETLQPGEYTVQVSGVGGGTGIGLVEVYEVP